MRKKGLRRGSHYEEEEEKDQESLTDSKNWLAWRNMGGSGEERRDKRPLSFAHKYLCVGEKLSLKNNLNEIISGIHSLLRFFLSDPTSDRSV